MPDDALHGLIFCLWLVWAVITEIGPVLTDMITHGTRPVNYVILTFTFIGCLWVIRLFIRWILTILIGSIVSAFAVQFLVPAVIGYIK